ncbi:hypothetical protein TNCV_3545641 [Trichonephila clavipes]|nr:hypothetical protein TNCV_3545641 [Trichonephila clavipes]
MKERSIALNNECPKHNERMGLYERKSAVLDGFEWRCRIGMFNHFLAECIWRRSHCHSLSDEAFKAFLKSAVMLYLPLEKKISSKKMSSTISAENCALILFCFECCTSRLSPSSQQYLKTALLGKFC